MLDIIIIKTKTRLFFSTNLVINLHRSFNHTTHYYDVIMTSLTVAYSAVYSDTDQRKHQSSASLAFVWGIHRDRWIPRTKGQLRGKMFPFDDVIMGGKKTPRVRSHYNHVIKIISLGWRICRPLVDMSTGLLSTHRGLVHIDGLMQGCSNSSALAMELLQSCSKPSIYASVN